MNGRLRYPPYHRLVERDNQNFQMRSTDGINLKGKADWPYALEIVERSINTICYTGLSPGVTSHEVLFTYGRARRCESLIGDELARDSITNLALEMTPEVIDDACFQQELTGNNAVFVIIDDLYNRLPTTEEAFIFKTKWEMKACHSLLKKMRQQMRGTCRS